MKHHVKQFGIILSVTLALAALAAGEITLIEDFSTYPLDESIHNQGDWTNYMEPHWQAQRNNGGRGDHGWSTVVQKGNKVALELINRDFDDGVDTVYTAMNLGANHYITNAGTIYVRFMAMQDGDTLMATNNYWAGWNYSDDSTWNEYYQGAAVGDGATYANSSMLVELNAEPWRARNGGGYEQFSPPAKIAGTVYELWMPLDAGANRCRFYLCEDQGTPTPVLTQAGGEWWAFRSNQASIENLKFFAGGSGHVTTETQTYVESIAVNTTQQVIDRPAENVDAPWTPGGKPGDADGDGDVDLDDFVILKQSLGQTPLLDARADFDRDGDVDLDDFVVLKQNFGQ